jgi:hypothetical protein
METPEVKPRLLMLVVVGVLLLGGRLYFEVIPLGASVLPFYYASERGSDLLSPGGHEFQVYFNDAGAAHSGNYWTWVVERRIWGRVVVVGGYLNADVRYGSSPVPVKWVDDKPQIEFERGRR